MPENYYFDEVYHAFTAKAYANNDPRGYEWWNPSPEKGTAYEWLHPPVSKLLMATGIKLFGPNSFGWRINSAIFGTLTIYLVYALTKSLFNKTSTALLAAFLASLDGLLLVQSRIAMNDIFVTTFILASLLFYWRWRIIKTNSRLNLLLSGIFTGLAVSTKWSGIFLLGIIGIMELIFFIHNKFNITLKKILLLITCYLLLPSAIYLLSYTQFFLQNHTWTQFKELHNQIIRYETTLDATHPYQSKAWQWPLLLRPIWYHVEYNPTSITNIYALSNPAISWLGLISIAWIIYQLFKNKKRKLAANYWLLTTGYFLVWIAWAFSPRIMFYYHYTPAIPFLAISLALFYTKLCQYKWGKNIVFILLLLTFFSFIFFFPIWTGLSIDNSKINRFFWLHTWR